MPATNFIKTPRLRLRPVTLADAAFYLELLNSEGWLDNIGDRGVYDLEQAEDYIRDRILPAYSSPGIGPLLCELEEEGTVIGTTGVYDRPGLDLPDFGFAFLPGYHGRGYAYEASVANLAYARDRGHSELLAITLPRNEPSLRLLAKLGFEREELVLLPGDDEELIRLRWRAE